VKNFEIARCFYDIATLLEARQESRFKIRAYQRAAQTLETLGEDVAAVAARGGLQTLSGIGRDLAARITEYLETGEIPYLATLRGDLPAAFPTLIDVRGLGPKTALALYERLGIDSIDRLEEACRSGAVLGIAGIREKTRDNILKGIAAWRAGRSRTSLSVARAIAGQIIGVLQAHGGVDRIEVAGSVRRGRETVKDIDILVTSHTPERVMRTFVGLPMAAEVLGHGPTRATILHQDGLHVDLRVVEPAAFGAALQYFTGSKDHNVRVREIAVRKGLKVSEYGVFDGQARCIAGATEEDVYAAVGLPWIPPELRENGGEIEAARAGRLPALVTVGDLRGDLHAHTDWSDGRHSLDELIAAAETRGYEYIIVSDHSKSTAIANGLDVTALRAQRALIRELQPRFKIRILAGSECDILADGTMDFPDDVLAELDVVLAAVHSRFKQGREAMTRRIVRALEHPHVDILVHPTGRRIGSRDPYDVDLDAVFATAKARGKAVEINCSPERLDLPDVHARRAAEAGLPIAISTDTHGLPELDHIELGLLTARRAWIGPAQVLNAKPLGELLAWTRRA
jgi:DNA polymerase (family 10)